MKSKRHHLIPGRLLGYQLPQQLPVIFKNIGAKLCQKRTHYLPPLCTTALRVLPLDKRCFFGEPEALGGVLICTLDKPELCHALSKALDRGSGLSSRLFVPAAASGGESSTVRCTEELLEPVLSRSGEGTVTEGRVGV